MSLKTGTKRRTMTNVHTGEVAEFVEEYEYVPRARIRENYSLLLHSGIQRILDTQPTGAEMRLVLLLILQQRINGSSPLRVEAAARELNLHPQYVYTLVRSLEKKGLIVRPGRSEVLVHPAIAWRGTEEARLIALPQDNEATGD